MKVSFTLLVVAEEELVTCALLTDTWIGQEVVED